MTSGAFLVLMFLVVSLPTGSVFGINIKVVAFGVFLPIFLAYLLTSREGLSLGDVVFLASVSAFFCLWSLIGILNVETESTQVLYKLRDMVATVLVAWLCIFTIRSGIIQAERLIAVEIYGMFAVSALKLGLLAGSFFFSIDPVEATRTVFYEAPIISGPIPFGLIRMMLSPELLGAFALFALLAPNASGTRFGRASTMVISTVLLASAFVAFSRYIWVAYLVAIFAALIVQRNWKALAVMASTAVLAGAMFYDFVGAIFESRFLSSGTEISDVSRNMQLKVLVGEFKNRPILGKGMGAHATGYLRDTPDERLYVYELEWLAFLMQFGIVGMIGLLLLVGLSARDLVLAKHPAAPWMWILFLVWLLAGFTNPYLTSSSAGGTFGLFMAMFHRMRNPSQSGESRTALLLPTLRQSPGGYT
jgi:hypothetical protein